MREIPGKRIPENQEDIRTLLYEQVPLLIKKLSYCEPKDSLIVAQAIMNIVQFRY